MRRRLILLHLVNASIVVCLLTWLGAQAGMTSSTLAAPAATLADQPALAAVLPNGPAPLPNHVVRSLAANTNPNVPLGGWTTYSTTNSSIGANDATSIALDAGGRPWVGHTWYGGLSVLEGATWTNYYSPSLVNNWVTAVAVDGRNQVWAGSPTWYNINIGAFYPGGVALRNTLGAWSQYLVGTYVSSIAAAGNQGAVHAFAGQLAGNGLADYIQRMIVQFLEAKARFAHVQFLAAGAVLFLKPWSYIRITVNAHEV